MGFRTAIALLLVSTLATWVRAADAPAGMVLVPAGSFTPLFRSEKDPKTIEVAAFYLDTRPVTNGEFLEFVRAKPQWRRSAMKRLFADNGYLRHWAGDLELPAPASRTAQQPAVFVSWFAAKAYCAWKGKRLPGTVEWEHAAGAGFTVADGSKDTEFNAAISRWYSTPSDAALSAAGSGKANFFGARDLHGLIWEWTGDFNSAIVSGDARSDTDLDRGLFCGAGSLGAKDPANFPAFMRFGMRSSLKAGYTIHNLGFRAAKDP